MILLALAGVAWWQLGPNQPAGNSAHNSPGLSASEMPADEVTSALMRQLHDLAAADNQNDFVRAAGNNGDARSWSQRVWKNLQLVDATELNLRYVSGGRAAIDSSGTREARVQVRWRPGSDSGLAQQQVSTAVVKIRIRPISSSEIALTGAQSGDGRMPLWLAGALTRKNADGAVVYAIDGGSESVDALESGRKAAARVRRVIDDTKLPPLAIIDPGDERTLASLVDESTGSISGLAAVTSSLDGSQGDKARVIFTNPDVFDSMDKRASQIVMTHEATHALTAAVGAKGPDWVFEGFADWVALYDDSADLRTSAGQILDQVVEDGPPDQLPTAKDFDAERDDLGTVYESAWMVFRMLAKDHSDHEIIAFYRAVLEGVGVDTAARKHLGLTVDQITARWRRYLENRASIVSE